MKGVNCVQKQFEKLKIMTYAKRNGSRTYFFFSFKCYKCDVNYLKIKMKKFVSHLVKADNINLSLKIVAKCLNQILTCVGKRTKDKCRK